MEKVKKLNKYTFLLLAAILFTGCAQFDSPVEIPEAGTIEVITTADAKCVLYRNDKALIEWMGSRRIEGLVEGEYKVKITSERLKSSYEEAVTLGPNGSKKVETATGALDIKIRSDFNWELRSSDKLLFSGRGSYRIDTLWTGTYGMKVTVPGVSNSFQRNIDIAKSQTFNLEMEYGSIDVRVPGSMECVLLSGNTELQRWNGSRVIDSLWTANYTVKVKVNPLLPDYESSFTLAKQQVKVVELEYGSLEVKVLSQMECVLLQGTKELERWFGSKTYDPLWVGDYTVRVKVNPLLPDYETIFTLAKQQMKLVEPGIGSFVIKTKSDYQNTLFRNGVQIVSWSGSKEFAPYFTGSFVLKSVMFPSAPPVEQNFKISPNENRTIEWDYGNILITGEEATCKLKRDGVEVLDWSGNRLLDSVITGNYSVEIQHANSPFWSENFALSKDQTKSVAIPYGSITVTTNVPATITKLIYNGAVSKTLTGNGTISNIVPGNYTLSFEAAGYAAQTETIAISNGQQLQRNVTMRIAMVYIPSGTFTMGCTSEQSNCNADESPTHLVTLSAYEIGKYEITQKQWLTVMGTNPSHFTGDNKPVEQVSWYDAISFCNALSSHEGLTPVYTINGTNVTANWNANGYRLPTEAEWEYAARGGTASTGTKYSGSNNLEDVAWYYYNSGGTSHIFATKSPNQLGIYDMSGNVWEWCWDWYSNTYYTSSSQTNPRGPTTGVYRALRLGGWNNIQQDCRVSSRYRFEPNYKSADSGFRVVRSR